MSSLGDLPIRDELRGQSPYGPPRFDVPVLLNSNENTHPVSESVIADVTAALAEAVPTVNRYPDNDMGSLRDALAGYLGHGLTRENVWAANGSNEIIQQLLQAFGGPGRSVLSFEPSYSMYPIHAEHNATTFVAAERDAEFELSPESARAAIEGAQPDVVFLCSPNNPTGTPLSLETIAAAYEASDGIVLVDEAYQEFAQAPDQSALTLLDGCERLVVSRTLSKAFAFAGVRLGYVAASAAVVDALRLVRMPYHVSTLTQAAAQAVLRHSDEVLATVADIAGQRDRIVATLTELGLHPYRSASNFVTFGGVSDPQGLFDHLVSRGILVRPSPLEGHLRVTAGTEPETTAFLEAVSDWVARPTP